MELFRKQFKKKDIYILKKNIQNKKGLNGYINVKLIDSVISAPNPEIYAPYLVFLVSLYHMERVV